MYHKGYLYAYIPSSRAIIDLPYHLFSTGCLKMTVFNIYMYSKEGTCIYYRAWHRTKKPSISVQEEYKLMHGMIYSIKSFVSRMSPSGTKDRFIGYKTNSYHLHFMESTSGVTIIMNTDCNPPRNVQEYLRYIYASIYVQYIVKNPFVDSEEWISSELFASKLDEYVKSLPCYS